MLDGKVGKKSALYSSKRCHEIEGDDLHNIGGPVLLYVTKNCMSD